MHAYTATASVLIDLLLRIAAQERLREIVINDSD